MTDPLAAIGLKQPADFIPGAELQRALDDEVCVIRDIQVRKVVFLKIRLQSTGDLKWRIRALHGFIINLTSSSSA
ncbi:hypothetical protein FBQ79_09570 [Anaerolineae bacterium AMX1]|nr:hypothetical protein [Anaerolineae bacterium AMX1]